VAAVERFVTIDDTEKMKQPICNNDIGKERNQSIMESCLPLTIQRI